MTEPPEAGRERVKVYWFDDQIACIDCVCGQTREMIVHDEVDRCENCGRGYRVIQYVEVVPPA